MASNIALGKMLSGIIKMLDGGGKSLQQSARLIAREGAVVSGRTVKASVRRHVPVFKPGQGLFKPYGTTRTRAKYPMRPGELRDSIYFTNARNGFNWKRGKLRYLVGFPHAHGSGYVPGWYAHWVEFGHWRVNKIAENAKTGFQFPLRANAPRRRRIAISWVPGQAFMQRGISAVTGELPGIMRAAMTKQLGIEVARLRLR